MYAYNSHLAEWRQATSLSSRLSYNPLKISTMKYHDQLICKIVVLLVLLPSGNGSILSIFILLGRYAMSICLSAKVG